MGLAGGHMVNSGRPERRKRDRNSSCTGEHERDRGDTGWLEIRVLYRGVLKIGVWEERRELWSRLRWDRGSGLAKRGIREGLDGWTG